MNIYLYLLIGGACIAKWLESFKVARNIYYFKSNVTKFLAIIFGLKIYIYFVATFKDSNHLAMQAPPISFV